MIVSWRRDKRSDQVTKIGLTEDGLRKAREFNFQRYYYAGIYGFLANIYFYDIDTPLKQFVASRPNPVRHCRAIHEAVMNR